MLVYKVETVLKNSSLKEAFYDKEWVGYSNDIFNFDSD